MRFLSVLWLVVFLSSCTLLGDREKDETADWGAERLYAQARGMLDGGYYEQAIEKYAQLEARFPFGQYAQQATLDMAYAYYKQDQPEGVIATAERFIKLYPQNRHVAYAYYIKALANFHRGQNIIQRYLPIDDSRRDVSAAMQAFEDFSQLLRLFPDSIYHEDARQRMRYLRNMLAQHEIHVANYYIQREAFVAAANRARYVIERYPTTPAVADALLVMAQAYRVLGVDDFYHDTVRVLRLNYPEHPGLADLEAMYSE